jgi:hypothetical protein
MFDLILAELFQRSLGFRFTINDKSGSSGVFLMDDTDSKKCSYALNIEEVYAAAGRLINEHNKAFEIYKDEKSPIIGTRYLVKLI